MESVTPNAHQQRIEFLTDAAQIGVWFCDLPFSNLEWDHRVKEHFWLAPDAPVTIDTFFERIHPDDRERTQKAIEKSIATKTRYEIDYRTVAADGRMKWIRAIGHPHFDSKSNPIRFDGITIDITSRIVAENRNRFLVALDDALRPLSDPQQITLTAARVLGQRLHVDRCAYADVEADENTMNLMGNYVRSPEIKSIVGVLKFSDFGSEVLRLMREDKPFVVDDVDTHIPAIADAAAYRSTQIQSVICVPLHKAGRFVAAMAVHMATPRRWNSEEVELVRAVAARCWESIQRARLERGLREQARVLQLLRDTGAAIASELDLQTVVQIVTDAATKLCGAKFGAFFYNTTDDRGESYVLYTLSGAPREAFEKFGMPRNTLVFHPTFAGESIVRSDDITKDPRYGKMGPHYGMPKGHLPVRSYLAVPVISRGGSVIGGLFFGHPEVGVFTAEAQELVSGIAAQASIAIDNARLYQAAQREIAERKRVAEELNQAREKLSHHAEDLEKQVALRTASLQEALAQLEEFSYSVSHDLRAPLRAIAGYNKVIRDDYSALLPPDAVGYLDRIQRSSQRLDRLVTDVLTMTRVARAEINLHPVPLQRLLEDIVDQYPNMQKSEADISVHAPHVALGDEVALGQALTNLLSNSVKFVAPGERPKVSVRSEQMEDRVRIWVEDSGLGIPEQHREKLFAMFQRMPGTAKFEGSGIGLAIVRKAVERMGGKVGMEPNQPRGSRFWIELKGAA
jgi:PAS domain S-box-containing protein